MPEPSSDHPSVGELLATRVLDAELAALVWILLERGVPLVVAEPAADGGASAVLGALLDLVPTAVPRVAVATAAAVAGQAPDALLVADPILEAGALAGSGSRARALVRAAGRGQPIAGTIRAAALEEVVERLAAVPVLLGSDELSRLGVVLVMGAGRPVRVMAAHYLRPVARDAAGHVQRPGPAILATFDAQAGSFDHFAWGIVPELAFRVAWRAGDLEAELAARRDFLRALVGAGKLARPEMAAAIESYRRHRHGPPLPG